MGFFSFAVFTPKNRSAKIKLLICKLIMLVIYNFYLSHNSKNAF